MDDLSYQNLTAKFFVDGILLASKSERLESCFRFAKDKLSCQSNRAVEAVKKKIKSVELTFMKKWRESNSVPERFHENNVEWLHRIIKVPLIAQNASSFKKRGRPKANFNTLSKRSKSRRAAELKDCEIEKLLLALVEASKKNGEKDLEYVIKHICKSMEVATELRHFLETRKKKKIEPNKISPLRALTHLFDNRLSKSQYVNTRLLMKDQGADIFPAYNKIVASKLECRPPTGSLMINEISASLPLQGLLDHTAMRLLLLQEDVITFLASKRQSNELTIKLQLKWGFDGSSNQSQYNIKFADIDSSDAHLVATTVVPLRMTLCDVDCAVVFNNPNPQTPRWCRPLRLQFQKETPELTLQEKQSVEDEIKNLKLFQTTIAGIKIIIIYEMHLTMIDGKVLNVITATNSNQRCYICKCTPKQFNNLDNISTRFKVNLDEPSLKYGISVLHLWIRSFEWLLHISYRLKDKKWQMRGKVLQDVLKKRKEVLQKRFLQQIGLRVDFPSSSGSGNTNSGPVARRAFSNPDALSEILEVDVELIKRMSTILIALSCQLPLDVEKFYAFCEATAHFYVSRYWWFPMPPTVHKVLIHSREIMLANELPLGVLAEDASESCNKLYRHNRQFHARKFNRQINLMDVFNRALDSSDPLVASFGQEKRLNSRKRKCLPAEVLDLLKIPEAPIEMDEEIELDLDEVLSEVSESLDGLCLPEDPHYEECFE